MDERVNIEAPEVIRRWLFSPYQFFTYYTPNHENLTLLDGACGENSQRSFLDSEWKNVTSVDKENFLSIDISCDILDIKDCVEPVDVTFSFETIEHLKHNDHRRFVNNLLDISKKMVVIGSVNLDGQTFLDDAEIWKGDKNPFHLHEYGDKEWVDFFTSIDRYNWSPNFLGVHYKDGQFSFSTDLNGSVSNYVVFERI